MNSIIIKKLKEWSWDEFALIFITIFPILGLWQISLFQYTLKYDMMDQYFPFRYFIGECISNDTIPWWNPYIYLGYPFYADPQSGFWYPFTWILGINGYSIYDLHIEFMFHILIAGYGFFYLLRCLKIEAYYSLIFAISYEVCGFFIGNAQHITYIIGASYIPWIIACFIQIIHTQKYIYGIAFSLFFSLCLSGGYPAITIILIYILILYYIYIFIKEKLWQKPDIIFKTTKIFSFSIVLTFIISVGYIVSIIRSNELITRGMGVSAEKSLEMPFPPQAIISILYPYFTAFKTNIIESDISMINGYFGIIGLLFLPLGVQFKKWKDSFFWIGIGIITLMASFGAATPIRLWLYHYVPLMNLFRFPSIFRIFFIISFLVVAAYGFQNYIKNKAIHSYKKSILVFIQILISISILIIFIGFYKLSKIHKIIDYSFKYNFNFSENEFERLMIQVIIQLVFLIGFYILFKKNPVNLKSWILLLVVFDLYIATQLNMKGTVISDKSVYRYNLNLSKHPKHFPNYGNNKLSDFKQFDESLIPSYYNQTIFFKTISDNGYNPFQLKKFILFEESIDRKKTMEHAILYFSNSKKNQLKIKEMRPNYFEATIRVYEKDTLNLLQTFDPSWSLKLDNKNANIIEKNNGLMSALVSSGNQKIIFEYKQPFLKYCIWIQFILQSLIVIYLIKKYRQKKSEIK